MAHPVSQCLDLNMFFFESVMLVGELCQRNHDEVVRERLIGQIVCFLLCAKGRRLQRGGGKVGSEETR